MEMRRCLSCKGSNFIFNYHSLRYTREICQCCINGEVPKYSNDDGFGPFGFKQHLRTTEITRNNRMISETIDVHESDTIHDVTLALNGVYSIADLEAMVALVTKVREAGKYINCDCCKWGRFTPIKRESLLDKMRISNERFQSGLVIEEIDGNI